MCEVLVISTDNSSALRNWAATTLSNSGLSVESAEAFVDRSRPDRRALRTLVAVIPQTDDPDRHSVLRRIADAAEARVRVVAVSEPATPLPGRLGTLHDVVRLGDENTLVRARLIDAVLNPGPFRAIVAPGVTAPTGVAVWMDTHVIVSCDDKGLVVSVDANSGRSTTLRHGVREPHGLWLDRRHLLIASKGSNRVHVGELIDGRLATLPDLPTGRRFPLLSPHFAMQIAGTILVVDTDHSRILRARGSVLDRVGKFDSVEFADDLLYPCGANMLDDLLIVADTMHNRLLVTREGETVADMDLPAPVQVAITPDSHLAVIATDGLRLVRVRRLDGNVKLELLRHDTAGGSDDILRTPFGVAADRSGRLYVADRGRGVVWSAYVAELLGGHLDAAG